MAVTRRVESTGVEPEDLMQGELQRVIDTVAVQVGPTGAAGGSAAPRRGLRRAQRVGGPVRLGSILRRGTTPDVLAWFRMAGVMDGREPVRTPA
jgi:hypothetical protein